MLCFGQMKLLISLIFTFVSFTVMATDGFELKYACTSKSDATIIKYLLFNTIQSEFDLETKELVVMATNDEVEQKLFKEDSTFIIKARDEEQFITLKNKVQLNPETLGESSLEFNDELTLNHKTELSVESCGADYTGENCLIIESYQCISKTSIATEVKPEENITI